MPGVFDVTPALIPLVNLGNHALGDGVGVALGVFLRIAVEIVVHVLDCLGVAHVELHQLVGHFGAIPAQHIATLGHHHEPVVGLGRGSCRLGPGVIDALIFQARYDLGFW